MALGLLKVFVTTKLILLCLLAQCTCFNSTPIIFRAAPKKFVISDIYEASIFKLHGLPLVCKTDKFMHPKFLNLSENIWMWAKCWKLFIFSDSFSNWRCKNVLYEYNCFEHPTQINQPFKCRVTHELLRVLQFI